MKVAQEEAPLLKRAFRLLEDTESKPHSDRKRKRDYDVWQKGLRSKQESFKSNRKHHRLPSRGEGITDDCDELVHEREMVSVNEPSMEEACQVAVIATRSRMM